MATRETNTPKDQAPFTPNGPAPSETTLAIREAAASDGDDIDAAMGSVSYNELPDPLGVQPVYFRTARLVKPGTPDARIVIELQLSSELYSSEDSLSIWINPNDRRDCKQMQSIIAAFGVGWDLRQNKPETSWNDLKNQRARAVLGVWFKNDGSTEVQVSKFTPMFPNTAQGIAYRDVFVSNSKANGVAVEMKQIEKGKYKNYWQPKGSLFSGCGVLPLSP